MDNIYPKTRKQSGDDNMIPMINIVFLLLIFFMIAGQIKPGRNNQIDLPQSDLGTKAELQQLQLEMDRDNQLALNGVKLSLEELDARLDDILTGNDHIALLADRQVQAVELDKVLQLFRNHNTANLTLFSQGADTASNEGAR